MFKRETILVLAPCALLMTAECSMQGVLSEASYHPRTVGKTQSEKLMTSVLQSRSWRKEVPYIPESMFSINLLYPPQGNIQYEWHNLDVFKAGIPLQWKIRELEN